MSDLPVDFAWALIGPGAIAHRFAQAVHALPGTRLASVHGRNAERAAGFATHWTRAGKAAPRVEPDLSRLLADPRIDAVYIATPHASHGEFIAHCLDAGKPVLCEKPMLPTLHQTQQQLARARQRRVFLMEALWTRFLPLYEGPVAQWLRSGLIGPIRSIQASFCFDVPYQAHSRMFDPVLAGGSLLDIGIYCMAMTRWTLQAAHGECPPLHDLHVAGVLAPTGVDRRVNAMLVFEGGAVAQFVCAFDGVADNSLQIIGGKGAVRIAPNFWESTHATLLLPDQPPVAVDAPPRINGFEGEIEEAMRCIREGLIESPRMPHAESLALAEWTHEMLGRLGVRYPFE